MDRIRVPLSMGRDCRPRFQIDRFMTAHFAGYQPEAYFFDHLMKGGLPGVANLIERDFQLGPDDVALDEVGGQFIPRDRASGMAFLHDFGCVHKLWDDRAAGEAALAAAMPDSLAKFAHLGQKTRALLAGAAEVVLIYLGPGTEADFRRLQQVLATRYRKHFLLVNVLQQGEDAPAVTDGSVLNLWVNDREGPKIGTPQAWTGNDDSWDAALSRIPFDRVSRTAFA